MSPENTRKPLLCRLNLHAWKVNSTEDGQRFRRCQRCGKDKFDSRRTGDIDPSGGTTI